MERLILCISYLGVIDDDPKISFDIAYSFPRLVYLSDFKRRRLVGATLYLGGEVLAGPPHIANLLAGALYELWNLILHDFDLGGDFFVVCSKELQEFGRVEICSVPDFWKNS